MGNRLKEVQDAVQVPSRSHVIDAASGVLISSTGPRQVRENGSMPEFCALPVSKHLSSRPIFAIDLVPSGAAQALENANEISEGIASEFLISLLEVNLPKSSKKHKVTLGVSDKNLAGSIKAAFTGLECETGDTSEVVQDMLRGIRQHAPKLLKQLQDGDVERAQLGLGHAYSRAQVKFSVQKNDNHIIQAIATLDHLDKAINNFSMRVREW